MKTYLLEVGPNREDLVDQIFNGDDTILAETLLDELIVGQRDALAVNLSISTLIYELTNALEVRFTVGNPRLNNAKHFESGFGEADEDAVVNLEETKELEDLAGLGGDLIDTIFIMRVNSKFSENPWGDTDPLIRTTKTSLAWAGT